MKIFTFIILSFSLLFSCGEIDEEILPIVGVYEANVIGVNGPFSISITADSGDDIFIEAPFDGHKWEIIPADIDDKGEPKMEIEFFETEIAPGVFIDGEGFFYDYTIQLNYEIEVNGHVDRYTIIGTKL